MLLLTELLINFRGFVDAHMTFGHETMKGLTKMNLILLLYFFVLNPPSTWCFPFNSGRTCRLVAIKVSLMLSPEPKVSPWINHRGINVSIKKRYYLLCINLDADARHYNDKEAKAAQGFWNCPRVPMRERYLTSFPNIEVSYFFIKRNT